MPRDSIARALAVQALAAGGGTPAWGSITGTLASQTDLSTALGAKATGTGTANGTNTGDQTITLTGNVTGSGTGSFATTIAAGAVTLAMQANMATASLIYRKTAGSGAPEVNTLATLKTDLGLTGTNSGDQTITLTGDVTGSGVGSFATTLSSATVVSKIAAQAIAPASVAAAGAVTSSSATGGIGYATGAGGAVTQLTSRTTGVTLSKPCGTITLFSAAGSATWATFTVTNTLIAATDTIEISQKSGANLYNVIVTAVAAGSFNVSVSAVSGTATEAPAFNFVQVKAVAA